MSVTWCANLSDAIFIFSEDTHFIRAFEPFTAPVPIYFYCMTKKAFYVFF